MEKGEKCFKHIVTSKEDKIFVNFGGELLEVRVNDMGYDYAEVEVTDESETEAALKLKNKIWIVYFSSLLVKSAR